MKWSLAITLIVLALVPRVADADPTAAEQLYEQGQAAFDAHRFDEAAAAWERSYDLSKEPGLLFNIGQAYRQNSQPGDCAKARNAYVKFLELDASSEQRPIAEGFLDELERCIAKESSANPPQVTAPSPAIHTEPAPAPADEPASQHGRIKRIVGIGLAAVGVGLVAVGVYDSFRVHSLDDQVARACAPSCDWGLVGSLDAQAKSAQRQQWIFYGLGAAEIAIGGVLYWLGTRGPTAPAIGISPGADGAAITWSGSW